MPRGGTGPKEEEARKLHASQKPGSSLSLAAICVRTQRGRVGWGRGRRESLQPPRHPASIPGWWPQRSHPSPGVDGGDSRTTCFPKFFLKERGWRQGAGGLVFLLPAVCLQLLFLG